MRTPAERIIRILELARKDHRGCAPEWCGGSSMDPCDLANALEGLDEALAAEAREAGQEEAGHWEPATWSQVKNGDRVSLNGVEARVEVALPLTSVGSGATVVQVKLAGRETPYTMPPAGAVDIWRPSLPDWAAQAYLTLQESFGGQLPWSRVAPV